eukprot:7619643-Karenia_brevis.AAC.1
MVEAGHSDKQIFSHSNKFVPEKQCKEVAAKVILYLKRGMSQESAQDVLVSELRKLGKPE